MSPKPSYGGTRLFYGGAWLRCRRSRRLVLYYPGGGGGNKHWSQRMGDGKVIHAGQCGEYCSTLPVALPFADLGFTLSSPRPQGPLGKPAAFP